MPNFKAMKKTRLSRSRWRRVLLLAGGSISLVLGGAALLLPVIPTTPFLLLAAWCFTRSSPRLHYWLFHNRLFGRHLRRHARGEGMTGGAKTCALLMLWPALAISAFVFVPSPLWWLRFILLGIGIGGSIYILRLPTTPRRPPQKGEGLK